VGLKTSMAGGGADGAEQVGPFIALLAQAAWPLAAHPSAVAGAAFLADPALVLEPQLDALARMMGATRESG
jgi:hypothetical protein